MKKKKKMITFLKKSRTKETTENVNIEIIVSTPSYVSFFIPKNEEIIFILKMLLAVLSTAFRFQLRTIITNGYEQYRKHGLDLKRKKKNRRVNNIRIRFMRIFINLLYKIIVLHHSSYKPNAFSSLFFIQA